MSNKRTLAGLGVVAALTVGWASTAAAASGNDRHDREDHQSMVYRADLNSLNASGAHGVANLRLEGNRLNIRIDAQGLLPNSVHAQHIHGVGSSECPPPSAAGSDGILSTADGLPFYGPIVSSLTTSGKTTPAEGLAIAIMPVADAHGEIHYSRTITLPWDVANNLGAFQIVQHGVDFNHNGSYDFGAGVSELDASLPQEATAPADCGTIDPVKHHDDNHEHENNANDD